MNHIFKISILNIILFINFLQKKINWKIKITIRALYIFFIFLIILLNLFLSFEANIYLTIIIYFNIKKFNK